MASELLIRSNAAELYARALLMTWQSGVRLWDPSIAAQREPDIEAKLLRDADIAASIKVRLHMIAGSDWTVEPATDSDVNKAAAKVIRELLMRLRRFTEARFNLARAFISGQRFAQMQGTEVWLPIGDGKARLWNVVTRLVDKDKRRFQWFPERDEETGGYRAKLQVLSSAKDTWGQWIDVKHPEHLVKHSYDDSEEMLGYGRGLREALYWWWYAKEHIFRESLQAAERFGQGLLVAKIAGAKDANGVPNTQLVQAWKDALDAMRAEHVIVADKDDEIEVVQMAGTGWQLLSTLREELRVTCRTLILGSDLTTSSEGGGGGSYALARVQQDSTAALIGYDRETLEETLTEDLVGYLWRANWHNLLSMGLGAAEMPRFKIKEETQPNPQVFSGVLTQALGAGMPIRQDEAYAGLGLTPPKDGDQVVQPQAPGGPEGAGGPPGLPGGAPGGQPGLPSGGRAGAPGGAPGGSLHPGDLGLDGLDLGVGGLFRARATLTTFVRPADRDDVWPELRRIQGGRPGAATRPFEWDESKHPRDDQGRFIEKDAIAQAAADPEKAKALRARVSDPQERKKLDALLEGRAQGRGQEDESAPARTDRDRRLPPVGHHIRRTWRGNEYVVLATESGFRIVSGPEDAHDLVGRDFSSLTAVAKAITGAKTINGIAWFGLGKRIVPGAAPPEPSPPKDDPPPRDAPPSGDGPEVGWHTWEQRPTKLPPPDPEKLAAAGFTESGKNEWTHKNVVLKGPRAREVLEVLMRHPTAMDDPVEARRALRDLNVWVGGKAELPQTKHAMENLSRAAVVGFAALRSQGMAHKGMVRMQRAAKKDWLGWFNQSTPYWISVASSHASTPSGMAALRNSPPQTGQHVFTWGGNTSMPATVVHETGHQLHYKKHASFYEGLHALKDSKVGTFGWAKGTAWFDRLKAGWGRGEISRYGSTSPHEFIAETFTRKVMGWPVSDEVMGVYREMGGAELPGWEK